MNYELKDKINVTNELLSELENKGWQEIEYLQSQIANLADGQTNSKLAQLYKNLLTSYYVFVGGIEILAGEPINNSPADITTSEPEIVKIEPTQNVEEVEITTIDEPTESDDYTSDTSEVTEPFEYFVDFDDPIGEPLTDDDLYTN
jgi:hypothetical protein